jgi:hypothetical protein
VSTLADALAVDSRVACERSVTEVLVLGADDAAEVRQNDDAALLAVRGAPLPDRCGAPLPDRRGGLLRSAPGTLFVLGDGRGGGAPFEALPKDLEDGRMASSPRPAK